MNFGHKVVPSALQARFHIMVEPLISISVLVKGLMLPCGLTDVLLEIHGGLVTKITFGGGVIKGAV